MASVGPPPIHEPQGSTRWFDWFNQINQQLNGVEAGNWVNINFAGSNLTDVVLRAHNDTQGIQGGASNDYFHLTSDERDRAVGNEPYAIAEYTVATAPTASSYEGNLIYVSDGDSGSRCIAISNGTDWKVVALGSTIST